MVANSKSVGGIFQLKNAQLDYEYHYKFLVGGRRLPISCESPDAALHVHPIKKDLH